MYEFIKDVEGNLISKNTSAVSKIRYTVSQLNRFLDLKINFNAIDKRLIDMYRSTKNYCKNNLDIIFMKADKDNITVAMCMVDYKGKMNDVSE